MIALFCFSSGDYTFRFQQKESINLLSRQADNFLHKCPLNLNGSVHESRGVVASEERCAPMATPPLLLPLARICACTNS